jgi:transketolase
MSEPIQKLPRDAFIDEIYDEAIRNDRVYFMSADLGAKALDRFRKDCPGRFINAGICEQNMMDVAAGLAQCGKIVYLYAMAPYVTLRCFEQIKVSLGYMGLPATLIGNGIGYSYTDAGPTHYAVEDITCMRALSGCEIVSCSDNATVIETARRSYRQPSLRYVRLDRKYLPDVYAEGDLRFLRDGVAEVDSGECFCIVTNGYMLHKAREVRANLQSKGHRPAIVDVYRIKPIDLAVLRRVLEPYDKLITLEEHFLSGGIGGAILEAMADAGFSKPTLRLGIPDRCRCENGGRDYILGLDGLDVPTITDKVLRFIR